MRIHRFAWRVVWLAALSGAGVAHAAQPPAASFTVRADWFDRGNVQVSTPPTSYAKKYACIWNAGVSPNQSEYDIDVPVTADYTFVALYTALQSRPVDIYLDGKKFHRGFAGTTGAWTTDHAKWERQCAVRITKGRHTIKLVCGCMPHICAFRLESPVPFPKTWVLNRKITRAGTPAGKRQTGEADRLLARALTEKLAVGTALLPAAEVLAAGPAARNELFRRAPYLGKPESPWVARLTARITDKKTETASLEFMPDRLRKKLDHALRLIADFREMQHGESTLHEAERRKACQMLADVDALAKQPDSKQRWERYVELYVAAYRLEHHVVLSNPLLDFDRLLVVKRRAKSHLGLPCNWQSNSSIGSTGYDNEIAVLSPVRPGGALTTFYKPDGTKFVGDVDLHFDADKMLFSSVGADKRWHVLEIQADGTGLRQVTPNLGDVNYYDACYLPDGRILFTSTAYMTAVPCVNGSSLVANLYLLGTDGKTIRQLCFDQEHDWCPTVLNNGRVLYLRWEYTDTPHSHDRVLFHMNPDGTEQMEYYGSNSYWPNSLFYARPIPGHPTKFVGIVSGHHGTRRAGELVLFDPARGRREAAGAIQRIPGYGKEVKALIEDNLVDASWPKFLHPYPLSDKFFLVAAKPTFSSLWGIYLVDIYDHMLLLKEEPGFALFEPLPFRRTPKPPVIADKVDLRRKDAVVYLTDIHEGGGLRGIPRGAVKTLRLFTYHFLYPHMGGPQAVVGMEGPWDIKRIIGTVPVEPDGSALFRVPANTPIALQPLDAEGKALQLMRSWFTGMPGEVVSCVGCHESQNTGVPARQTLAARRLPSEIKPWRGPTRGFNFLREVQHPVLDKHCVGCHNGQPRDDGKNPPDLTAAKWITDYRSVFHSGGKDAGHFTLSYAELHRYVRRPGLESDYHMLTPMEFHADTTQLVQMLRKGHHNVQLDADAWDRLITWIDLNAPFHGTWTEIAGEKRVKHYAARRRELLKRYANLDDEPEAIPATPQWGGKPLMPAPVPKPTVQAVTCPGWPFDAKEATRRQAAAAKALGLGTGQVTRTLDLGGGLAIELALVPAGELVMGSNAGFPDERPLHRVKIARNFWMGTLEVTNEQFAAFDPRHDSRVEAKFSMQFGVQGFPANGPKQPVVRLSWERAMAFCAWLSAKTGKKITLPTEAQWEWACRAGTATPFSYGDLDTDFSKHANLADAMLREFVCHCYHKDRRPYAKASKYDDWIPKDTRFHDGSFLSEPGGQHQPNAWGLLDMHGNVWEWTRSASKPYPYRADDGRNDVKGTGPSEVVKGTGPSDRGPVPTPVPTGYRVARGGSWRDRPKRARSAFRLAYRPYQSVYNVGFRVVCLAD